MNCVDCMDLERKYKDASDIKVDRDV